MAEAKKLGTEVAKEGKAAAKAEAELKKAEMLSLIHI